MIKEFLNPKLKSLCDNPTGNDLPAKIRRHCTHTMNLGQAHSCASLNITTACLQ